MKKKCYPKGLFRRRPLFKNTILIVWSFLNLNIITAQCDLINCPEEIVQSITDGSCGSVVNFATPTFSGTCPAGIVVNQTAGLVSGSTFPLGITTVTFTLTDGVSNIDSCSFDVVVTRVLTVDGAINVSIDALTCEATLVPGNVTNPCPGLDYTIFVTVNDVAYPNATLTGADLGAEIFYTIIDPAGNMGWGAVNLEDKIAPTIICPDNVTVFCGDDFSDLSLMGEATATDCSEVVNIYYEDESSNGEPCSETGTTFIRTWYAVDAYERSSSCEQQVTIMRGVLNYPPNLEIACQDLDASEYPTEEQTGTITVAGESIVSGHVCGYNATFADVQIPTCGFGFKIIRTFTIVDCCSEPYSLLSPYQQTINIVDEEAPGFPDNYVPPVPTAFSELECSARLVMPPLDWEDTCGSVPLVYSTFLDDGSQNFTSATNGVTFFNVPLGEHLITYTATDDCGNASSYQTTVVATDDIGPTAVCDDKVVAIDDLGEVCVPAIVFDDFSSDNCGILAYKVKRMDAAANVPFTDCVMITCENVVMEFAPMVRLRVYDQIPGTDVSVDIPEHDDPQTGIDENGRFSECMVTLLVQDKIRPAFTAIPDLDLDCAANYTNADGYINVDNPIDNYVTDNCGDYIVIEQAENNEINNCGNGTITRSWLLTDPNDPTWLGTLATQTIVLSPNEWSGDSIIWPSDYFIDCSDPTVDIDNLPAFVSAPTWFNNNGVCEDVVTGIYDEINAGSGDGFCQTILRRFFVWDICQGGNAAEGEPGYFLQPGYQTIQYFDNMQPVFDNFPDDMTVSLGALDCSALVDIPAVSATDICATTVAITVSHPGIGSGSGGGNALLVSGSHGAIFTVTYTADDGCGNTITQDLNLTIEDTTRPTPAAISLGSVLMDNGTLTLGTTDFLSGMSTFDNCTPFADLVVTGIILGPGNINPDPDNPTGGSTLSFNCDDLGTQNIAIWVTDEAGNSDVVVVEVQIQDNNGACPQVNCPIANQNLIAIEQGACVSGGGLAMVASLVANLPGSEANYNYYWEDVNGNQLSASPPFYNVVEGLSTGAYYVTITEFGTACVATLSAAVNCGGMRIGGIIANEQGEKVNAVSVNVTGLSGGLFTTESDGHFIFEDVPENNNYTVIPEKNTDHSNGVTTFDLVLISQHILGVTTLDSPYKIIAADINRSGTVTTLDVVALRRLILNVYDAFPENTSWRFVDKDFVFENPGNPFEPIFPEAIAYNNFVEDDLAADFIAVKIGDLNASAIPNNFVNTEERTDVASLFFTIEEKAFEEERLKEIAFRAREDMTLSGFQFALGFNEEWSGILHAESTILEDLSEDNFVLKNRDEGKLLASWHSAKVVEADAGSILFFLKVKTENLTEINATLEPNASILKSEVYDENLKVYNLNFVFESKSGRGVASNFDLYQNRPNPFSTSCKIGFVLPKSATATLTIFDFSGKVIKSFNRKFSKGFQEIELTKEELGTTGVLYYRLETAEHAATKKMVLLH